jgi:hypothetical protein
VTLQEKGKRLLVKLQWFLAEQVGLDIIKLQKFFLGLPWYFMDYYKFKGRFPGKISLTPCLHDRLAQGGNAKSEYFWQDLLVAQRIFDRSPIRHVDIGSRIDGFVAHVAAFRQLEVLDIRPIESKIGNVIFRQVDLMSAESIVETFGKADGYSPSVSCLHALEHFGLGRYGDALNPKGYQEGLANICKLLSPKGTLYLSTPIGVERVEFNANWVFDPLTIISLANKNGLYLNRLTIITSEGVVAELAAESEISKFGNQYYHLGLFEFQKN